MERDRGVVKSLRLDYKVTSGWRRAKIRDFKWVINPRHFAKELANTWYLGDIWYTKEKGGNTMIKPITVGELIATLKTIENKKALVGISVDSEGNGYSLIPSEQFLMEGYVKPKLGLVDIEGDAGGSLKQVVILFGSN